MTVDATTLQRIVKVAALTTGEAYDLPLLERIEAHIATLNAQQLQALIEMTDAYLSR